MPLSLRPSHELMRQLAGCGWSQVTLFGMKGRDKTVTLYYGRVTTSPGLPRAFCSCPGSQLDTEVMIMTWTKLFLKLVCRS